MYVLISIANLNFNYHRWLVAAICDTHCDWQEMEASLKLCALGKLGMMTPEAYLGKV